MKLPALIGIAVLLMLIGMGIFFIGRWVAKKNQGDGESKARAYEP